MKTLVRSLPYLTAFMCMGSVSGQDSSDLPKSRAEKTGYKETTLYAEVISFLDVMESKSPLVRRETFGRSEEGRDLPLVILHDPPVSNPVEARATGKPIVFVNNNIHAGEVEGKEAALHMIRDLIVSKDPLLKEIVLLIAPIYNADGNERVDMTNRPDQHGPSGGVGQRANVNGLDLNRDFTKLASSESRGLVGRVFRDWDPHLFIDCHTTNGSYHGYGLTYEPSLHPDVHSRIASIARDDLLPSVTKTVKEKTGYETFFYAHSINPNNPSQGYRTYDWRPRYGSNYYSLRNRFSVLSEAYAYLDFEGRVKVTEAFVLALCRWVASHSQTVLDTVAEADRDTIRDASSGRLRGSTRFEAESLGDVPIIVEKVERVEVEGQRRPRVIQTGEYEVVTMPHFGAFKGIESLKLPAAYLVPSLFESVIGNLLMHGVSVERLTERASMSVEVGRLREMKQAAREFQGHKAWELKPDYEIQDVVVPKGTYLVRTAQPLARLIFHLFEAQSDDGYASWGFLDEALGKMQPGTEGAKYPLMRVTTLGDINAEAVSPKLSTGDGR